MKETLGSCTNIRTVLDTARSNLVYLDFPLTVSAIHHLAKLIDGLGDENQVEVMNDVAFQELVAHMHFLLPLAWQAPDSHRHFTDVLYALGKLETTRYHHLIKDLCMAFTMPYVLPRCTQVELSTVLWSLGRLVPCDIARSCATAPAKGLAEQIIVSFAGRSLAQLTPHCISEVMWASAKLGMDSMSTQNFMNACKNELRNRASLSDFSTQGLANTSWAIAKSLASWQYNNIDYRATGDASLKIIQASLPHLKKFEPLELSMSAWAIAKIHARGEAHLLQNKGHEIGSFVVAIAEEVVKRFHLMSAQSISNVAWALAKMDRMTDKSSISFFDCTVQAVVKTPSHFSPQAISNLCYAFSWLNSRHSKFSASFQEAIWTFGEVACHQALTRSHEFDWKDLSGVLVAVGPRNQQDKKAIGQGPYTRQLAEHLAKRVSEEGCSLTAQVALNISVTAARIGISSQVLRALFRTMSKVIVSRTPAVNDHDLRQYRELTVWYKKQCDVALNVPDLPAGCT